MPNTTNTHQTAGKSQPIFTGFRFDDEDKEEISQSIPTDEEEYREEARIEKLYIDAAQQFASGKISHAEYDDLIADLDAQYDPDVCNEDEGDDDEDEQDEEECEEEFTEISHIVIRGDDEVEEEKESERERIDREYEENCDRMLDEQFERDSDYC